MNNENRIINNRIPEGEIGSSFCLFLGKQKQLQAWIGLF